MPCETTASHRPVISMPAFLILQALGATAEEAAGQHGESAASTAALKAAKNLITDVPFRLLGDPDVSPFYGEIHISWTHGLKQVLLMCFPNRAPLIHQYKRVQGRESEHSIEPASPDRLAYWLEWVRV